MDRLPSVRGVSPNFTRPRLIRMWRLPSSAMTRLDVDAHTALARRHLAGCQTPLGHRNSVAAANYARSGPWVCVREPTRREYGDTSIGSLAVQEKKRERKREGYIRGSRNTTNGEKPVTSLGVPCHTDRRCTGWNEDERRGCLLSHSAPGFCCNDDAPRASELCTGRRITARLERSNA